MSLFVIADPHLSLGVNKPMNIFGQQWQNHDDRLRRAWLESVSDEDTVIIPGDISWGMHLIEALPDLQFLHALPGKKILLRGNHDYWWTSLSKLQQLTTEYKLTTLSFLRNNAFRVGTDLVCGTRGWLLPEDPEFTLADRKIFNRETGRLQMSLTAAEQLREPGDRLVVCLHYPPLGREQAANGLLDLIDEHQVDLCVYGHIHGIAAVYSFQGQRGKTGYVLSSADYLGFKPLRL